MSPSIRLALIWVLFAAVRIGLVLLLARGRLKPLPTLSLFVGVEIAYFLAFRATTLFGHRETVSQGAFACTFLFASGMIPATVLWFAGHSRRFLIDPSNRSTFYRAFLLVPAMVFMSLVQYQMVTGSTRMRGAADAKRGEARLNRLQYSTLAPSVFRPTPYYLSAISGIT